MGFVWGGSIPRRSSIKGVEPPPTKGNRGLAGFVSGEGGGKARPMILREIVEACFIDEAMRGWANAVTPLLEKVLTRVAPDLKQILTPRVAAFRERHTAEKRSTVPEPMAPADSTQTP